ncbi:hypothetical protein TpMuguga_02g00185 [Theileria parva strain Muguga]|uniref:Uncharacterized protein n=1 Tax=Theileria parva TaxID=5875 RepID=Q4N5V7_THEPA|nr:uncharacterized protein TpMuguga_02g00185 [Theileria parva strain Muguga]EAN32466.1 hypothetical protein TpMuguga_02g00185 [Theileria parva strain Muguga]|eukprot:XP_764749.1 hypothetical protein [Theileria parva strain Muguga]
MNFQPVVRNFKYFLGFIILFVALISECGPTNKHLQEDNGPGLISEQGEGSTRSLKTNPERQNKPINLVSESKGSKYDDYSSDEEKADHTQSKLIVQKFDFIVSIFPDKNTESYKKYEHKLLTDILTKLADGFSRASIDEGGPFVYFNINTTYDNLVEFRRQMVNALLYIDEKMKDESSFFFKVFNQILDNVPIFEIINEIQSENQQFYSLFPTNSEGLVWDLNLDDLEVVTEPPESAENLQPYSEVDQSYTKPAISYSQAIQSTTINSTNDNSNGSSATITPDSDEDNFMDVEYDNSGSQKGKQIPLNQGINLGSEFNKNVPSTSKNDRYLLAFLEDLENTFKPGELGENLGDKGEGDVNYWNQHLYSNPELFEPNNYYELGTGSEEIKKFLTFLKEGFVPSVHPFRSPLAQAMTAAMIIMQETGIVDFLAEHFKMKRVKTKFLFNMLFEEKSKKDLYIKDVRILDKIQLDTIYEYNGFKNLKRNVHPEVTIGGEELRDAAITFSSKLFPKIELSPEECAADNYKQNCVLKEFLRKSSLIESTDETEYSDLEDVLKRGKLMVLVYPNTYSEYSSFIDKFSKAFHHRVLTVAMEIIRRRYCNFGSDAIEIEYVTSKSPVKDLLDKKGHMTGMNFMIEDPYPSKILFGTETVTLGVPILSYNTFIVVHRKHKLKNLEDWYRYINRKDHENKVILTNYSAGSLLFSNARHFKILSISIQKAVVVPFKLMDEHKPAAGVFWGIYHCSMGNPNYVCIHLPYNINQAPRFRAHY